MSGHGSLTLAIETSNPSAPADAASAPVGGASVCVGLASAGGVQILAQEPLRPAARHDDDLMAAADRAMARAGLAPRQIQRVAVSVGPGGYTSLRVACAAGKMIAEAAGAPCVAVPSAMVAAVNAISIQPSGSGSFAVALASKGPTAYVTLFDARWSIGAAAPDGRVMDAGGLALAIAAGCVTRLVMDRHGPAPFRAACEAGGVRVVEPVFTASACLAASVMLPDLDPAQLVPLYAREPEAVTLWRTRKKD